jgi:DNA ligase-1
MQPVLDQPFSIRRHLLRTVFPPFFDRGDLTIARFTHVESIDSTKTEDVQAFFEMVVSQKCEGLMVKLLESGEGLAGEDEDEGDVSIDLEKAAKEKEKANSGRKKPLPSTYEPDARSQGWLKVKKGM